VVSFKTTKSEMEGFEYSSLSLHHKSALYSIKKHGYGTI
jgi:hypothetical protein